MIYAFFSGKFLYFGKCAGVKHLTNIMSVFCCIFFHFKFKVLSLKKGIFKGGMLVAHGVTDDDWKLLIHPTMKKFMANIPQEKVAVDRIGPQV